MTKTKKSLKPTHSKAKRFIFLGFILLIVAMVVVLAVYYITPRLQNMARYERITEIYDSLGINEQADVNAQGYLLKDSKVFGEKRVYEWDKSRTYSSAKFYTRGANVDVTAADLDKKIKDAGFVYFDEPYPGSMQIQYHYKSEKGEYIRLSVDSKPRADAFFNTFWMKGDMATLDGLDPNAGPSNITIKVNLDDNNE